MASKQVIALAKRILDEFGLDADPDTFTRTYVGRNQREAGAYSWIMYCKTGVTMIGSGEPIRKCVVKRNRIILSQRHYSCFRFELFAYEPGEPGYEEPKPRMSDEGFVDGIVTLTFE